MWVLIQSTTNPILYKPIKEWVESKGGRVVCSSPVLEIVLNEGDSTVKSLKLANGTTVTADYYVSAIPVDVLKRLIPTQWSTNPYFRQLDELEGIPVINTAMVRSKTKFYRWTVLQPLSSAKRLRGYVK